MKRSFKALTAIKWVLGVFAACMLAGFLIFLVIWWPVLDRLNSPCKYYPNTFVDC